MSEQPFEPSTTAILIVDLQNDFLHAKGAYGRSGTSSSDIAKLPSKVTPLLDVVREAGGWIISTQFTLVPGKNGEPFISTHLKKLRPFLAKGDFMPSSWGHSLVNELQPADITIEKVAYSAFYQSRLDFLLVFVHNISKLPHDYLVFHLQTFYFLMQSHQFCQFQAFY